MAIPDNQEVRDLLKAARATRDYCMVTGRGGERAEKLIDALAPFDGDTNGVSLEHLIDLRKAMRDVCRHIDDYTLTQILDDNPPVRIGPVQMPTHVDDGKAEWFVRAVARTRAAWPTFWQRVVLPGLAIVLLLLAMHYTHWSFNANLLLNRLDDHIATDVHEEIRDLIVVARAIEANGVDETAPSAGTPAQKVFNETMSKLTAYHHLEYNLHYETTAAVGRFDAVTATREALRGLPAKFFGGRSAPPPPTSTTETTVAATAPEATAAEADTLVDAVRKIDRETSEKIADTREGASEVLVALPAEAAKDAEEIALVKMAMSGHNGFLEIVAHIAEKTGRNTRVFPGDHVVTRLELLRVAQDLKENISVANRFALPMIYGSLGAALFCLVRVLTPSLSDLGPARAFLRILFGAFAAMTLSMLFIPANIFTINEQSNPTLIFLACFLFGYSFDAVLSALHRMEAFLQGRLQPQEAGRTG